MLTFFFEVLSMINLSVDAEAATYRTITYYCELVKRQNTFLVQLLFEASVIT